MLSAPSPVSGLLKMVSTIMFSEDYAPRESSEGMGWLAKNRRRDLSVSARFSFIGVTSRLKPIGMTVWTQSTGH